MNLGTFRPSYAIRRLRQERFWRRHPEAPWLTAQAIVLLENWLRPTDIGIEWGSGRSTAWFASHVTKVLSIEDNRQWYDRVSAMLREKSLQEKVDYRYVACPHIEIDEPETADYALAADAIADGTADFVLVDGNIRATCMWVAVRKLKAGGLLILDNANRYIPNRCLGEHTTIHEPRDEPRTPGWSHILQELRTWRAILTSDGIWDTRFWVKPCG